MIFWGQRDLVMSRRATASRLLCYITVTADNDIFASLDVAVRSYQEAVAESD